MLLEVKGSPLLRVEVLFPFARLSARSQSVCGDLFNVFLPQTSTDTLEERIFHILCLVPSLIGFHSGVNIGVSSFLCLSVVLCLLFLCGT